MRIFSLLFLCFFIMASLTACDFGNKIAVVNIQEILNESENARKAKQHFYAIQNILQENLNIIQRKLEQYPNKEQVENLLAQGLKALQQELDLVNVQINKDVTATIYKVINIYQQEHQYDLILLKSQTIEYSEQIDITDEISKAFDTYTLNFVEIPQLILNPSLPEPLPNTLSEKEEDKKTEEQTSTKKNNKK